MTVSARPVKRDRSTTILLLIAALVAIGGIAFAIGRLTAPTAAAATANGNNSPRFGNGGFGRNFPSLAPGQTFDPGQFGGGLGNGRGGVNAGIEGTVQSIDGSTLTLKLANGTTVTLDLGTSTTYHKEAAGTQTDITPGSTVRVSLQIGQGANPGASPAPGASAAPRTASDVTLVAP